MAKSITRADASPDPIDDLPPATPNVPLRASDHQFQPVSAGERFGAREVWLSRLAGAAQLHVNLLVVPAGKQSGPFHYHLHEEEHFYVLDGRCVLRSGDGRHEMAAGDYVCFPAGTGVGHALENPFDADCSLLSIGPSDPAEIAVYPDSGKAKLRALETMVSWPQESLDYWHGEAIDAPLERR